MSFPYTASADSISVRLVWIIWGEGKHEELGSMSSWAALALCPLAKWMGRQGLSGAAPYTSTVPRV